MPAPAVPAPGVPAPVVLVLVGRRGWIKPADAWKVARLLRAVFGRLFISRMFEDGYLVSSYGPLFLKLAKLDGLIN